MVSTRLGRYELLGERGRGGMSVVYEARDPVLERRVAIKVLHPHLATRTESRERFTREAKAVARLHHRHIVEVHDYSPPDSEQAYIVTEYIDGPTLRRFVEEHPVAHSEVAALLMLPVLDALAHAHAQGIVHRDVKPENVMIGPRGGPVLMDFGIAQMIEMETLTATGTMLGSPAHMAPEVVDGDVVGPLADVFSAGTMLYWLVCGALPFSGPNPAALFRRILETHYDPVLQRRPQAGRRVARLIEACLARRPEDRPPGAAAVADQLRSLLEDGGLSDVDAELAALRADPSVYQDQLGRRLVPAYLRQAERAVEAGAAGRALDFLDRILALDEDCEEAQSLLRRLERSQRRGRAGQVAVIAGATSGLALMAWALLFAPTASIESPDHVDAGSGALASSNPPPVAPPRAVDASPEAAPPLTDAAAVPDAAPAVVDASRERVATRAARSAGTYFRRRPLTRSQPPPLPADAGAAPTPPPPPVPVPIKVGTHKGWQLSVDDGPARWLYELRAEEGIPLTPGRHRLRLDHAYCQTVEKHIQVRAGHQQHPPVLVECVYKPARLRISAQSTVEVRRKDDGRPLGRTNGIITYEMSQERAELALTVGDPADRFEVVNVELTAGKTTTRTVNF